MGITIRIFHVLRESNKWRDKFIMDDPRTLDTNDRTLNDVLLSWTDALWAAKLFSKTRYQSKT